MATEEVHVLMVTLPFQGHINPMLRFAKRLASKGVHVTLATTEGARQRLVNTADESPKIQLEFFPDGLTSDLNIDQHIDLLLASLQLKGRENLSDLIANLADKGRKFSCIINQPFVPWVADVAAEIGIPCAMLFIQSFALYVIYYRYHKGLDSFPSLENPNEALEVPGLPLLEVKDLPTFILPSCPNHFKKLVEDSVHSLEKVKWVLGNSFYELEADIVQSMSLFKPLLPVGPLLSSTVDNAQDSCLEWLDKELPSSVVYIAFGSITVLPQNQIANIAMALKNTNRPFLWVLRQPELIKNDELPDGRGMVVSWCVQEKVLRHKAVACFMSHCGWNSTLEAVVAGVPMIAFPGWTDQPTNAKLLVDDFQMGVRMRPGEDGVVTKEEVERCIFEITDGPRATEMKKRAMDLREAARKAVADGGSSDTNVVHFISEIIGQSAKSTP